MHLTPSEAGLAATGRAELHLGEAGGALGETLVHQEVAAPLHELLDAARSAGFALAIASGFRGFDRQLSIWNRKATGELPVLDNDSRPLDIATLTPRELVFAILRWSALPGASRHHWGTDFDVYDGAACPEGYEVQLVPAECEGDGYFAPMHRWLDERIARGAAFGFFRPYDRDRGGVAPERWHLSHAPTAATFAGALTVDLLHEVIGGADLRLKDVVLDHLTEIHERFVTNVNRVDA